MRQLPKKCGAKKRPPIRSELATLYGSVPQKAISPCPCVVSYCLEISQRSIGPFNMLYIYRYMVLCVDLPIGPSPSYMISGCGLKACSAIPNTLHSCVTPFRIWKTGRHVICSCRRICRMRLSRQYSYAFTMRANSGGWLLQEEKKQMVRFLCFVTTEWSMKWPHLSCNWFLIQANELLSLVPRCSTALKSTIKTLPSRALHSKIDCSCLQPTLSLVPLGQSLSFRLSRETQRIQIVYKYSSITIDIEVPEVWTQGMFRASKVRIPLA
jgi:hypothetical protein